MAASNRNRLLPISAIFVRKSGRPDFRAVVPSFVLREPQDGRPSKSAVADFDTLRLPKSGKPDFGARPPQDEVFSNDEPHPEELCAARRLEGWQRVGNCTAAYPIVARCASTPVAASRWRSGCGPFLMVLFAAGPCHIGTYESAPSAGPRLKHHKALLTYCSGN